MIANILGDLASMGRAVKQEALDVVLEITEPWAGDTQQIIESFLLAHSVEIPSEDAEAALAYYDTLWSSNVAFILTEEDGEYPGIDLHLIPIWPTDIPTSRDILRQQLQIVLEHHADKNLPHWVPPLVEQKSGNCWHIRDKNQDLQSTGLPSWCTYLWSGISSAISSAADAYFESDWRQNAEEVVEAIKSGMFIKNEDGKLSAHPALVESFPDVKFDNLQVIGETWFIESCINLAARKLRSDLRDYLVKRDIPQIFDLAVVYPGGRLCPELAHNLSLEHEDFVQKVEVLGITPRGLRRQFVRMFDMTAVRFFTEMHMPASIDLYNKFQQVENMERVLAQTPGAAFMYFYLLDSDSSFTPMTEVRRPDDIAREVSNYLSLAKGSWRRLSKMPVAEALAIYKGAKIIPLQHGKVLKVMEQAGVERLDHYGHVGISRGLYSKTVNDNLEYFTPVLTAYARQAALPQKRRRHRLTSRELAQDISDVMDWAMHQYGEGMPLSRTSQWGGFVRASDEWHREQEAHLMVLEAERYLEDEIRQYGAPRTWETEVGTVVINGYTVEPMISRQDLLSIGKENTVCVGRVSYYTDECHDGRFRIFAVRKDRELSILTIAKHAGDWNVYEHRGPNNESVDDGRKSVAQVMAEIYNDL